MTTPAPILDLLKNAEAAGVDMRSPKAVVTHWLSLGEKANILYFYKPNSLEFDFDKYEKAVKEMQERKK